MDSRRIVLTVIFLIVAGAAASGWYRFVAHPTQVVWLLQPAASCQIDFNQLMSEA